MKRIFSLLLVVSMLCAMMITANADANVAVGFTPSATTVNVGDTFTVDVYGNVVNADYGVTGMKIVFSTDDAVAKMTDLQKVGVAESLMGSAKVSTKTANATGTDLQTGENTWFTATFEAVAAGTFTISADTAKSYAQYKPVAGGTAKKAADFAPITVTIVEPVTEPDPVAVEKVSAGYKDFTADEVEFTNLFVAEYKLTGKAADKFFKITKVVVNGTKAGEAASKEFAGFETEFGGEAEITFKAALSGVDAPDSMSFDITAEYVD